MKYLHKDDRDLFRDMVLLVSEKTKTAADIIEKDYYVTILLQELAARSKEVVFKGGTSLSKAYHVIDRFSEDVDITFTEHLGEAKRKSLKYKIIHPISEELELPISNWEHIESDKDYNHYDFSYHSVVEDETITPLPAWVKLETALMSYAFPTEERELSSILYDVLKESEPEILTEYSLYPFKMRVQSLSRTLVDKVFAVCDYYMLGRAYRNSRHLYDIYKIAGGVGEDINMGELVDEVREHRSQMGAKIAPSAGDGVDIRQIAGQLCQSDFFRSDYNEVTNRLISDDTEYDEVVAFYHKLVNRLF